MKLRRALAQRPTPRMPELAGFEPRFDAIPLAAPGVQPARGGSASVLAGQGSAPAGLRPGQRAFRRVVDGGDGERAAAVLPGRRGGAPPRRQAAPAPDPPTLLAEAVWRLGALGWTDELDELVPLLRNLGLTMTPAPRSAVRCTQPIPGLASQPDWAVRVAYWWATALQARGWRLHACGEPIALRGFIAEIPAEDGDPMLAVYPPGDVRRRHGASALANHLRGSPRASVSLCSGSLPTPRQERAGCLMLAHSMSRRWWYGCCSSCARCRGVLTFP